MERNRWWWLLAKPGLHWVWVSISFYVIACFLPAVRVFGEKPMLGWECLAMMFAPWMVFFVYLFPNPLYYFAIIGYWARYRTTAAVLGTLAVLPALYFELATIWVGDRLFPGCAMWVASLEVFALNAIMHVWIDYRNRLELASIAGVDKSHRLRDDRSKSPR